MKASSNQIFDAAVKFIAAVIAGRHAEFSGSVGRLAYPDVLQAPQLVIDDAVQLAKRVAEAVEDDSVMTLSSEHIKDIIAQAYENHKTEAMPMTLLIENVKAIDSVSRATALAIIQRAEQDKLIAPELQGKKTIYKLNNEKEDDPNDPF